LQEKKGTIGGRKHKIEGGNGSVHLGKKIGDLQYQRNAKKKRFRKKGGNFGLRSWLQRQRTGGVKSQKRGRFTLFTGEKGTNTTTSIERKASKGKSLTNEAIEIARRRGGGGKKVWKKTPPSGEDDAGGKTPFRVERRKKGIAKKESTSLEELRSCPQEGKKKKKIILNEGVGWTSANGQIGEKKSGEKGT